MHNTYGHHTSTTRVYGVATHLLHYVVKEGIDTVTVEPESRDWDESNVRSTVFRKPRSFLYFQVQYSLSSSNLDS